MYKKMQKNPKPPTYNRAKKAIKLAFPEAGSDFT